jgi:ATP-binding cassette, subfamily C, bacterial
MRARAGAGAGRFLVALAAGNRRRLAWVLTVQMIAALIQGVGLLLLVPLLELAGVSRASSAGGLMARAREAFHALGIPLSLSAMLVVYVAVVTVAAALTAYQNVLLVRYRLEFVDELRQRLYGTIARAEWRHLLGLRQSDLLTALTIDVSWVGQGTLAVLNLGVAIVVITVQVAVALRISPAVTGLAMATGIGLAVLMWPLVARSRRLGRELVQFNRGVLASVTGFLDGLKLAKVHGLEPGHLTSFDSAIVRARRSQIDFAKAQAAAAAVQFSATAVVLAVLIDVVAGQHAVSLAELLVLAFIFTRLVPQVTQAQSNVQALAQSLPAFGELTAVIDDCARAAEEGEPQPAPGRPGRRRPVLSDRRPVLSDRPPAVCDRPPALCDRLRLDDVCFSYRRPDGQPVEVLHGVTLEVPARATTALVGPSGAGKTTIADLAVGLLVPTSGRVLIDGAALAGELIPRWREEVAMVPQDVFLFHESIRANLLWAQPGASEDDLWRALALASAEALVRQLPDGVDTVVGDRGERLSGGERQRIALARALLREPALLVLDEATSSLDAGNETAILDALAMLHGSMTILVIAHQRSSLRDADQVITVADGRVGPARRHDVLAGRPS